MIINLLNTGVLITEIPLQNISLLSIAIDYLPSSKYSCTYWVTDIKNPCIRKKKIWPPLDHPKKILAPPHKQTAHLPAKNDRYYELIRTGPLLTSMTILPKAANIFWGHEFGTCVGSSMQLLLSNYWQLSNGIIMWPNCSRTFMLTEGALKFSLSIKLNSWIENSVTSMEDNLKL